MLALRGSSRRLPPHILLLSQLHTHTHTHTFHTHTDRHALHTRRQTHTHTHTHTHTNTHTHTHTHTHTNTSKVSTEPSQKKKSFCILIHVIHPLTPAPPQPPLPRVTATKPPLASHGSNPELAGPIGWHCSGGLRAAITHHLPNQPLVKYFPRPHILSAKWRRFKQLKFQPLTVYGRRLARSPHNSTSTCVRFRQTPLCTGKPVTLCGADPNQ